MNYRNKLRLGYEGELVTAQELNNLTEQKIRQIVHQVDRQCKDIKILSKQYDGKK